MYFPLNEKQQSWADSVFSSLTMEEKVLQLIHPNDRKWNESEWIEILEKYPLGSVFAVGRNLEEMKRINRTIQEHSKVPVLISADMENGTNFIRDTGVEFPAQMGITASQVPEAAYKMGKITARMSRAAGVHWTFSPVIDPNLNPENPITNIRSLGDNPDQIIPLFQDIIRGLQEDDLMAATCKHFPGDGVDNRDQHMLVSANTLPFDQWMEIYGRIWKAAISAGTRSIMCGHIALPDYQGMADDIDHALPATLSSKLMTDLLRKELGFQGVIVSDAYPMVGFTCMFPERELAWRNIEAGSDSVLFSDPRRDFKPMMEALKSGKLSEERVETAARRIIEMKAALNLFEDAFGPDPEPSEYTEAHGLISEISEKSVTILRPCGLKQLPLDPEKDKKILTVSLIRRDNQMRFMDLEEVDHELRQRGFEVDHMTNPGDKQLRDAMKIYDKIFINLTVCNHGAQQLRLSGKPMLAFWHSFFMEAPEKVVYTSFGSPYVLYDHPYFENCTCVYGSYPVCQRSAVRYWCGEIGASGVLPVRPQKAKVKRWEF